MIIHKHRFNDEDADKHIVPDGHALRISMMAMDSVQQQIANQPALDQRVQHTIDGNKAVLAAARRNADKAQAWANHFSEQRQVDESAYGQYCEQLSDGWQQVTA